MGAKARHEPGRAMKRQLTGVVGRRADGVDGGAALALRGAARLLTACGEFSASAGLVAAAARFFWNTAWRALGSDSAWWAFAAARAARAVLWLMVERAGRKGAALVLCGVRAGPANAIFKIRAENFQPRPRQQLKAFA